MAKRSINDADDFVYYVIHDLRPFDELGDWIKRERPTLEEAYATMPKLIWLLWLVEHPLYELNKAYEARAITVPLFAYFSSKGIEDWQADDCSIPPYIEASAFDLLRSACPLESFRETAEHYYNERYHKRLRYAAFSNNLTIDGENCGVPLFIDMDMQPRALIDVTNLDTVVGYQELYAERFFSSRHLVRISVEGSRNQFTSLKRIAKNETELRCQLEFYDDWCINIETLAFPARMERLQKQSRKLAAVVMEILGEVIFGSKEL